MNMKRMRGRNHRPNGGGGGGNTGSGFRNQQNGIPLNRNHVFDSSGPEMRVRGTAQQLYEKYQQLARDSFSNGDRVTGEAYYQHAEHYFRIISAINQAQGTPAQGHPIQGQPNGQHGQNGQPSYPNANQGQERNGSHVRPAEVRQPEVRPAEAEPQNGQQNSHYNHQNRRYEPNNGDRQHDLQLGETVQHVEGRPAESRPAESQHSEARPAESRPFEPRRNESRNRPEFQRNDRQERYRPESPVVDTRIDISSALEAELAAAIAEPPAVQQPVLEARAIPIIPDAPPPTPIIEAAEPPAKAPASPKPRGRPRVVKAAPKE